VRITNNKIGPAGVGWDLEEFRWADGISYASSDGLIAGNLITDTTDGAIGAHLFFTWSIASPDDLSPSPHSLVQCARNVGDLQYHRY
jgi:hypothetical protein